MAKKGMDIWDIVAVTLLIVGGLVWGILGFFDVNVIYRAFGMGWFARVIFGAVGLSALYSIWSLYKLHR